MSGEWTALAVGGVVAAAWGMLIAARWRLLLGWLAVLQLGVFALLWGRWPLTQAAAWLVASWLATAILGVGQRGADERPEPLTLGDHLLRLTVGGVGVLAALSLAPHADQWIPGTNPLRAFGGLSLLLLGVLQLGLSVHPLRVIVGVLTALGGFLIFYAPLERSLLVTGLLAMLNIGLALIAGYLCLIPSLEEP